MNYKVGQRVKIKTWEKMAKEFGLKKGYEGQDIIPCLCEFIPKMEKKLKEKDCNRILTIRSVNSVNYSMKDISWGWSDDMIECLAKDYKEIKKDHPEPIKSRFEILDIR